MLGGFDPDATPQSFDSFFRAATQLGVVNELEVEVMRRAIQTGRRTERWCISEHWANVAQAVGVSGRYRYRCELSEAALEEVSDEVRARFGAGGSVCSGSVSSCCSATGSSSVDAASRCRT